MIPTECRILAILFMVSMSRVNADCMKTNFQVKIDAGGWYEECCTQMDGTQDLSYYAKFHSVNSDAYTTQEVVADDSGHTGHCAGGSQGPPDWKDYKAESYSDSFTHEEQYQLDKSGGTYLKTQLSFRVSCNNLVEQCQIQIDTLHLCNGHSCGPTDTLGRNKTAMATVRIQGTGSGEVIPQMPSRKDVVV